ncbi:MAG: Flp pilus assembly protein CpaB [Bdellovibrionales bacterium]|nr:Flp pilus assembly protein CpaB [Bdellovibrionales bacterium]
MGGQFGKNYPALTRVGRADERERLFFFAAAGLAAFLFFTVIFVLNFKQPVQARQDMAPAVVNAAPPSIGTETLLAPEQPVRAGTKLSEVRFKEMYWPRNQVPRDAARDISEIQTFYARVDIPEGMPIQKHHLTKEPMGISLPLTPGNRAVSIEVDATEGIEGWALPGTRVDVVLTFSDEGNLTSKILVQNARVLSYGGDATPNESMPERGRRGLVREAKKTITLEVTPSDALSIATARELGRLSLMMRAPGDWKAPSELEFKGKDLRSGVKDDDKKSCSRGSMRMDGREYLVGCDGTVSVLDSFDP